MSHAQADNERALAFGLAAALERALEPGASPGAIRAAREAARVLSLDALDALLESFERHAADPWPAEMEPVRDRLLRSASRCREEERLAPFREADAEWSAIAAELAALEWTPSASSGHEIASLSLRQTLEDLAFETDRASVLDLRLAAPVAASLRAALDWMAGASGFVRPLRLRSEESTVEIACEGLDPAGLEPAQRVIAAIEGSLGPNPRPGAAGWALRVPALGARDHFLMLEQGAVRLAIPWHSVLRMQTVPAAELETRAAALGMPLLAPLAPLATAPPEWPVVTVAHGLRRGWVIADRVIWRFAARACPADAMTAAAGLEHAVRTDDGEVYSVATARRLLGGAPVSEGTLGAMRTMKAGWPAAAEPKALELGDADATPVESPAETPPLATFEPSGGGELPRDTGGAELPVEAEAFVLPAWLEHPAHSGNGASYAADAQADLEAGPESARSEPAEAEWEPEPEMPTLGADDVTPIAAIEVADIPDETRGEPAAADIAERATAEPAAVAEEPVKATEEPAAAVTEEPVAADAEEPAAAVTEESVGADTEKPVAAVTEEPTAAVTAADTEDPAADTEQPVSAAVENPPADIAEPHPAVFSETPEPVTAALTALVVEDAVASRAFLSRVLADRGFDVVVADRARELDAVLDTRAWSLVLLDVELPDAAGASFLASALERLGHQDPPPPVVALVRDRQDVAVAHDAGIEDVLEKPVDEPALVQVLERLATARRIPA